MKLHPTLPQLKLDFIILREHKPSRGYFKSIKVKLNVIANPNYISENRVRKQGRKLKVGITKGFT